jgi:hypothetical protein
MAKQSFFGGWTAKTFKETETILETIWDLARVDFTGLRGFPNSEMDCLEFTGIRIRKVVNTFTQTRPQTQLNFEITDATKIQPEFLDLWDFLIANKILNGKLSKSEREMILASIASSGGNKLETEADKPEHKEADEYADKLTEFCILWVKAAEKIHRDKFDTWKEQEGPQSKFYEPWMTRTVVYDHLRKVLLPKGAVEKRGRYFFMPKNKKY